MAPTRSMEQFVHAVAIFLFINASISFSQVFCDRNISTEYNPGCNVAECKSDYQGSVANVAYVKAAGKMDTFHYLLSNVGSPTVLVLMTDTNDDVPKIDWEKLVQKNGTSSIAGAVSYPGMVKYSYAVVFTKLYEYDDTGDMADMNFDMNMTNGRIHDFSNFTWDWVGSYSKNNSNMLVFNTSLMLTSDNVTVNGSMSFAFTIYNHTDRTTVLPHLLYNDNITQFDFIIDHMESAYSKSRFGVEVALITTGTDLPKAMADSFNIDRSIDDEYTPGVFKVTNWFTNAAKNNEEGYIQWKPVCYTMPSRSRGDGTYVKTYTIMPVDKDNATEITTWSLLQRTVAYAYYGEKLDETVGVRIANISFGLSKDGFYTKTNYTVWTGNIGYGTPPVDPISILVIGIISAGLGIPVIIIIFGGVFVCFKKHNEKKTRTLNVIN